MVVDRVWEDSESVVEEEDEEEDDQCERTELDTCADLGVVRTWMVVGY